MDRDEAAMKRRDEAAAAGARPCPKCDGTGEVETVCADHTCPQCRGETWIDAQGHPYKID